jgi:enoyl-CoA hydratase/carnithine racemase
VRIATGAGDKAFCTGFDVAEVAAHTRTADFSYETRR